MAETAAGWNEVNIATELGLPPVANGSGIAAVSRAKKHMEVWWKSSDGTVQDDFWDGTHWTRGELAPRGSAAPAGGIAAISRQPDHMEVFWIGPLGSVQGAAFYDSVGHWEFYTLDGPGSATSDSAMCALSRNSTAMDVWWVGPTGSVEGATWNASGGGWIREHITFESSAAYATQLTAVARDPKTKQVFWMAPDSSVKGVEWSEARPNWQAVVVEPSPGAAIGAGIKAVSRVVNFVNLWWIKDDETVQGAYSTGPNPMIRYALPESASIRSGLTAVARDSDHEDVWWIGPRGELINASWASENNHWNSFKMDQAGAASRTSKMASVGRIKPNMEIWFVGKENRLEDRYWNDFPRYDFSIDTIECTVTRSRSTDTLYIAATLAIAGRPNVTITKALGDHEEGFTYPDIVFRGIRVEDGQVPVMSYIVTNDGHNTEATVLAKIGDATNSLAGVGATAAGTAFGVAAADAIASGLSAFLGTAITFLGALLGAAAGAVVGLLLVGLIDLLNPNCDGPVAIGAVYTTGTQLRSILIDRGDPAFSTKEAHPGMESPAGCGANSQYAVTWSCRLTPDVA